MVYVGLERGEQWHNFVGVGEVLWARIRVACVSQLWAGGRNPVGIGDMCKVQRGLHELQDAFVWFGLIRISRLYFTGRFSLTSFIRAPTASSVA